jgi:hypothetical protein
MSMRLATFYIGRNWLGPKSVKDCDLRLDIKTPRLPKFSCNLNARKHEGSVECPIRDTALHGICIERGEFTRLTRT